MTAPQQTLDVGPPAVEFFEKPYRHYKVNGLKVPSVTQIIGTCIDKSGPLKHWAQREAVAGVCALALQYGADDTVFRDPARLEAALLESGREINARAFVEVYEAQDCTLPWDRPEDVLRLLKQSEESINARMKAAADRGLAIHQAFEDYADTGKVPDPDLFPEAYRGYLRGLAAWIAKHRPRFLASELVVGSAKHGFGGRLDVLLVLERGDNHGLVDLKTNAKGRVYPVEHFLQVEAYALAAGECGHDVGDFSAVIAVGPDGTFEFRRSVADADHFLSLLPAYRAVKDIERKAKKA